MTTTPWDEFIDSIERKKKQLDEVLEAYRVFRQKLDALPADIALEAQRALASAGAAEKKDLAGKTALECVHAILAEKDEPLHFSAIAKEALRRGYQGRLSGSPEEVESRTLTSFWSAMSRDDSLESIGKGLYRLKKASPFPELEPEPESVPKEKSRQEQIVEFLRRHGPTQRRKILDETGIPEGTIGAILKEGPDSPFAKDATGRWYVREEKDDKQEDETSA